MLLSWCECLPGTIKGEDKHTDTGAQTSYSTGGHLRVQTPPLSYSLASNRRVLLVVKQGHLFVGIPHSKLSPSLILECNIQAEACICISPIEECYKIQFYF